MPSILAGWRVSLLRTRADWPIVAAAWLTMLLAATLLAAGPIYSTAVSLAGLRQTLADAPVDAANVQVSERVDPAHAGGLDAAISTELERAAGPSGGEIVRLGISDTFALPGQGDEVRDLALLGFEDGIEDHASLVAGSWPVQPAPSDAAAGNSAPVQVAVADAVAEELGIAVGDRLLLVSRLDASFEVPIAIVGVYRVDDPQDAFWWADPQAVQGITQSARYRTFGPFITSQVSFLTRAVVHSTQLSWRLLPDYRQLTIDDTGPLRTRVEELPSRLTQVSSGGQPIVDTVLPATLAGADRALLVSRTSVLLLMIQLAALGGYSILLTAGLLTDHRRVETALLRSRGAGPGQVGALAAVEGLFLAVPAAVLGPWLAVAVLDLFDRAGPLAATGIDIELRVTTDAYVAAAVGGAACVVLLALPAVFSARAFSAEQRAVSRQETRPLVQRLGLDVALLTAAAIGLWQLRLYGAPFTRTVQGTLGPDPLLVAAPALGLLAGAAVALRLLPRLAQGAERVLTRGRGLVGAMGTRQLARRPLRYTRSALLLMLAMSMGVFAVSYATTWTDSQRDQAAYQVGADVRVVPGRSSQAIPGWGLAGAYAGIDGVVGAMPVERSDVRLTASLRGTILALDAATAAGTVEFRPDQAALPLATLLEPLAGARPDPALVQLPAGTTDVIAAVSLDVRGLDLPSVDPQTGKVTHAPQDPAVLAGAQGVSVGVAVRDAHGLIHRFAGPWVTVADARSGAAIPLGSAAEPTIGLDQPLSLVSVDVELALPENLTVTDGTVAVTSLGARSPAGLAALDPAAAGPWSATWQVPARPLLAVSAASLDGLGVRIGPGGQPAELAGATPEHPLRMSLQPASIGGLVPAELPAVVSRSTLDATALSIGGILNVPLAGTTRRLRISGVVDGFPTLDPATPFVLVDLPTVALVRLQAAHDPSVGSGFPVDTRDPDEWWLDTSQASSDRIASTLLGPPIVSSQVSTASGRLRSLAGDPVAVGIIGALSLGAIAAGVFAIVGLAVGAAVSARQRQTEFALLRAVGLSRGQLAAWLWLENGSLIVVSLIAGTALGALISWAVLPSVTVSREGVTPMPPVLVTLPIDTIAVLELATAAALVVVVTVMAALLRRMGVGSILRLGEE